MQRIAVPPGSRYFYYPRLIVVVGARDDERQTCDFAPVAWSTPLSSDPPFFGICLSPHTYSHALVLRTGEFTVNFLPHAEAALCQALGRTSGRDVDKVRALDLELEPPATLGTPTLACAYASAECLLVERHQVGDQTLFVGEVQGVRALADAFDGDGLLRLELIAPLLYLGNQRYVTTASASTVTPPTPPAEG